MRPILRPQARVAMAVTLVGTALVAFGSVRAIPYSWPGQIVLSVFIGGVLLFLGAVELALALALRPDDALVEDCGRVARALRAGGLGAWLQTMVTLGSHPRLRWTLVAVFAVVAAFALFVVASDLFAYERLRWAIPRGGGIFIVS